MPTGVKDTDRTRFAIIGIIAQMPEKGVEAISNSRFAEEIQKIKTRHPELLAALVFSTQTSTPWSEFLDHILFCLGASGSLHRSPIDRRWYLGKNFRSEYGELFARYITKKELAIIEKEGRKLAERIAKGELAPMNP
jgi:hypothetical protein